MPKYDVYITRWEPQTSSQVIEAPTMAEARRIAVEDAQKLEAVIFPHFETAVRLTPRVKVDRIERVD